MSQIAKQQQVHAIKTFSHSLQAAVYQLSSEQRQALLLNENVAYIEEDRIISIEAKQQNATWGLDRIDQAELPLNNIYEYPGPTRIVNAYVIDTGIRVTHNDFSGRAFHGVDTVDNDNDATDCNGHGTHVAGTIGGKTWGVSKNVHLHGVRVLDCIGRGRTSSVIAGIDWVTLNHRQPAVANMSLGGLASQALDDAVKNSVAAGVTYVVAAGNSSRDACTGSPARVAQVLTVGSVDNKDRRSDFSNYGECVKIFAPGSDIESAEIDSDSAVDTKSGTSMASPHVAGAAALYLEQNPEASPSEVMSKLLENASVDKLRDVKSGSPNLLLNTSFLLVDDKPVEEPENELQNGVVRSNLYGEKESEIYYTVSLPENVSELEVEISGGQGDADLYVNYAEAPSLTIYECRPYKYGNDELCHVNNPAQGVWHIMLRGWSDYSNLNLVARFTDQVEEDTPAEPCNNCQIYNGVLSATGSYKYEPNGSYFFSEAKNHELWLEASGADFDVILYKWVSSRWTQVASSRSDDSSEYILYPGDAGYYSVKVESKSGSGNYKLWVR